MSLHEAETDFGLSLLRNADLNVSFVFSPLSIALALSLVHAGAKGATKAQIGNALVKGAKEDDVQNHYLSLSKNFTAPTNGVEVSLANRMYIRNGFQVQQSYLDTIKQNYNALAKNLDFNQNIESAKAINDFVEDATKEKIKNLVDPDSIGADTVAVLVNALHIGAKWQSPFEKSRTEEGDFFVAPNKTKKVNFMEIIHEERDYAETEEMQVLSLKYKDTSYAFNIFLPKEQFGLDKFRAEVTGAKIQKVLGELEETHIHIESSFELVQALRKLGIEDVFDSRADLSGIATGIKVSGVVHKAMIQVEEEETVAAAASAVTIQDESGPAIPLGEPVEFIADHPFLFALTKDRHPVFLGVQK